MTVASAHRAHELHCHYNLPLLRVFYKDSITCKLHPTFLPNMASYHHLSQLTYPSIIPEVILISGVEALKR